MAKQPTRRQLRDAELVQIITAQRRSFTRARERVTDYSGLTAHSDAGSQYTSVAFSHRLLDEGINPSVGSVGDAYAAQFRASVVQTGADEQ